MVFPDVLRGRHADLPTIKFSLDCPDSFISFEGFDGVLDKVSVKNSVLVEAEDKFSPAFLDNSVLSLGETQVF